MDHGLQLFMSEKLHGVCRAHSLRKLIAFKLAWSEHEARAGCEALWGEVAQVAEKRPNAKTSLLKELRDLTK